MRICKKCKNLAITSSIITLNILTAFVIVNNIFFTNDKFEKNTKVSTMCMYQKDIYNEPIEIKPISKPETRIAKVEISKDFIEEEANVLSSDSIVEEITDNTEIDNNIQESDEQQIISTSTNEIEQNNNKQNNVNAIDEFETIAKIEIPKTGLNTSILSQVTVDGMEIAPCFLYSTGELNKDGNTLIVGHNYNGIFEWNKNLKIGDVINITTLDGHLIQYTVYDKFIASPDDVYYLDRDTNNKPEITLSTCTDGDMARLIILGRIE